MPYIPPKYTIVTYRGNTRQRIRVHLLPGQDGNGARGYESESLYMVVVFD